MASKNKFEIMNGNVHISREEWKQIAEVTYREDYYEELQQRMVILKMQNLDGCIDI